MNDVAKLNDKLRKSFPKIPRPHKAWISNTVCKLSNQDLENLFKKNS
jgi:hypothetical protein